jgi:hypothetical protein
MHEIHIRNQCVTTLPYVSYVVKMRSRDCMKVFGPNRGNSYHKDHCHCSERREAEDELQDNLFTRVLNIVRRQT